jgi:hypothetical protein
MDEKRDASARAQAMSAAAHKATRRAATIVPVQPDRRRLARQGSEGMVLFLDAMPGSNSPW